MIVRRLSNDELYHHGVKGQRWGVRRYQNEDGSLTPEGIKKLNHYKRVKQRYVTGRTPKHKRADTITRVLTTTALAGGNALAAYFWDDKIKTSKRVVRGVLAAIGSTSISVAAFKGGDMAAKIIEANADKNIRELEKYSNKSVK